MEVLIHLLMHSRFQWDQKSGGEARHGNGERGRICFSKLSCKRVCLFASPFWVGVKGSQKDTKHVGGLF